MGWKKVIADHITLQRQRTKCYKTGTLGEPVLSRQILDPTQASIMFPECCAGCRWTTNEGWNLFVWPNANNNNNDSDVIEPRGHCPLDRCSRTRKPVVPSAAALLHGK